MMRVVVLPEPADEIRRAASRRDAAPIRRMGGMPPTDNPVVHNFPQPKMGCALALEGGLCREFTGVAWEAGRCLLIFNDEWKDNDCSWKVNPKSRRFSSCKRNSLRGN